MIAASTSLVATARTMASSVCIGFTVTRFMSNFLTRAICSELIVGGRAERVDRDRLAGEILEFLQAFAESELEATISVPS